ncbi:CHAD domain-containing protein [Rhodococcus sp. TAF43]|uniref:CHAD domain-containing protein n=1 Tax=unclassified Rhodococcus (in: high G+C Gram-positive bacteria) TaxID=192944 RepID=UPI001582D19E|nr:CHAD domain-containing protein [Rhodococcus sp. W8901]QKT12112.1 CHAD domain-containing protein [Rhodococcus sp. W8901]
MAGRKQGSGSTVTDVIVPAARGHYERLVSLAADVRDDADDSVHQMRVSARRLRSLLGTYRDAFPPDATVTARSELRWLGSVLGKARDAEVLAARFCELIDAQPADLVVGSVHQRLVGTQEDLYRAAHADAVDEFARPRYAALCALLEEVTSGREAAPVDLTLRSGLDKAYRQLRKAAKKVRALRHEDGADLGPALHRVRKRAKKLRYAAEAVSAAEPSAADLGSAAKALQSMLGDHQDGVLARDWIIDAVAQARIDDEDTFTYGLLYAAEEARAARTTSELPRLVKAIKKAHRTLDLRT